jgi:hypothetical protein
MVPEVQAPLQGWPVPPPIKTIGNNVAAPPADRDDPPAQESCALAAPKKSSSRPLIELEKKMDWENQIEGEEERQQDELVTGTQVVAESPPRSCSTCPWPWSRPKSFVSGRIRRHRRQCSMADENLVWQIAAPFLTSWYCHRCSWIRPLLFVLVVKRLRRPLGEVAGVAVAIG